LLVISTLTFSWLAMQAVHEFGHVLNAWLSGGRVARVVLYPVEISRTDVSPNPHPQFVAWGGPVWGSVLPLSVVAMARYTKGRRAWLIAFFAGFCLIANGAYLLGGSLFPVGDAEVLIREGAPRIALAGFGIGALALGLYFWNGLGCHFGLGPHAHPIDKGAAWTMASAAVLVTALELLIAAR
jgi:Peptidase M50B-like